jgi:DNA-binding CsgD family transcriptional regulator
MTTSDHQRADLLHREVSALAERTRSPVVHAIRDWVCGLHQHDGNAVAAAAEALQAHMRRWEAARANHDAAVIFASQAEHGRSRTLATAALDVYNTLGAELMHARLRAELRTHGLTVRPRRRPARPSTGWESLTPSERRIADLVASGMSNSEIAAQLFVSRRTVESHLARMYPKLGIRRRTELVAALATGKPPI